MSSSINHQLPHQVFVPVTDDLIYNHPEQIEGPLVPYDVGMECQNWLAIEINPEDDPVVERSTKVGTNAGKSRERSRLRLAFSS